MIVELYYKKDLKNEYDNDDGNKNIKTKISTSERTNDVNSKGAVLEKEIKSITLHNQPRATKVSSKVSGSRQRTANIAVSRTKHDIAENDLMERWC